MEARITKRLVDQITPAEKDLFIWDTRLKGFGLKITPKGTKTYIVQYRRGGRGAPTRRYTIGRHGAPWTADEARAEAEKVLGLVAHDKDPQAEKREALAKAFTVAQLADRYLEQHVRPKNKASTAATAELLAERFIKPALGRQRVADVTRGDISTLHHRMRRTPRQANLVLAVLSKMFSLAEAWGLRPDGSNPCRRIDRYPEQRRERFLSDAEVAALGRALAEIEEKRLEHDSVTNAVRLLLLTGCRVGEVLALRWEDVDPTNFCLHIRDAKAGGRAHPIGAQTIAFLEALPRQDDWVLPGIKPGQPLNKSTLQHAWQRVRAKAGLDDVRLHDLRHTVGTFAGQAGANAFLVRDKLGHRTLAMTGRYAHRDADPLRALSDAVESRVSAGLSNTDSSGGWAPRGGKSGS